MQPEFPPFSIRKRKGEALGIGFGLGLAIVWCQTLIMLSFLYKMMTECCAVIHFVVLFKTIEFVCKLLGPAQAFNKIQCCALGVSLQPSLECYKYTINDINLDYHHSYICIYIYISFIQAT